MGSGMSKSLTPLLGDPHNKEWEYPRSPGTHIVGPWVTDSINLYRVLRTGTQYLGNWASRGN